MASNSDLIAAVKAKPAIWDSRHIEHKNAKIVNLLWEEISKALGMETKSLKKKWRGLRDYYRSEYKRKKLLKEGGERTLTTKLAWPYYEMMSFVEDIQRKERSESLKSVKTKKKKTNRAGKNTVEFEDEEFQNLDDEDEFTAEEQESDSGSSDKPLTHKKEKRRNEFDNLYTGISKSMPYDYRLQMLELESQKLRFLQKEESSDEDLMFLKSLLPDLKTLPGHRKTYLKLQFQQMVYNEISVLHGGPCQNRNSERNTTSYADDELAAVENATAESNYISQDSTTLHDGFGFNNSYELQSSPTNDDVDIRNDFDDFKYENHVMENSGQKMSFEKIYLGSRAIKKEVSKPSTSNIHISHPIFGDLTCNATSSKITFKSNNIEFNKKGEVRQRKRYDVPLHERKRMMLERRNEKYLVKPACENCKKECTVSISDARRLAINKDFWKMEYLGRRQFILCHTSRTEIGRRTKGSVSKRNNTFRYFFGTDSGEMKMVCRRFFLTTLGFHNTNDKILHNVLSRYSSPEKDLIETDRRGTHRKSSKVDRTSMREHVESFSSKIFEDGQGTGKKYLTSDVNIRMMHKDFTEKHPGMKCSYELYRVFVTKECNISFESVLNK